jgi:UDP-N-acetylglucosamine 2-epimerase (non-hydrolysing)
MDGKKILLVAGARPNFMKIAPIMRVLKSDYADIFQPLLVHTGQHYDDNMSGAFFAGLGIAEPDYNLEVGSGPHGEQTAAIMSRFEQVCFKEQPDIVLVVGDVNSTIAAGLVAKKMNCALVHVEAGLRSGDRTMPEEINRLATDAIADLFFTTEEQGSRNLLREAHPEEAVHFVGHVMIDNLFYQLERLQQEGPDPKVAGLKDRLPTDYACMTLHRPSNVDHREDLETIVRALRELGSKLPIVFPCHPRTRAKLEEFGLLEHFTLPERTQDDLDSGMLLLSPLGYNDFLYLWKDALLVLTDSGGLQEETTALNIPCLTLRENTERPVTVERGSNRLIGKDVELLKMEVERILRGEAAVGSIPELWDGRASQRIVAVLARG